MPTQIIRADEIFTSAVYAGDLKKVEELLRHGAGSIARCRGEHGTTPLHWAASNNCVDMVKLLVEHGAEPNAAACDGCTALHYAAREDCTEAAQVLLQSGAKPDVRNNAGRLPVDEIYDDTSDDGSRLLRLLTHSATSLPASPAPAPASSHPPVPNRWGSRPQLDFSGGAPRAAAAAGAASGSAPAVRGMLSMGGGFGGGDDDGISMGGIIAESLGGEGAGGDDEHPDNCGHEPAVGSASGDGEAAAAPGPAPARGAVRVALGADGHLSDADYESIRRAYVVTGLGGESVPFAGWEQEDDDAGAAASPAGGPAAPRHASIGTDAMGEEGENSSAAAPPHAHGNGNGGGAAAAAAAPGGAAQPLDAEAEARLASFLSRAMGEMGIGGEFEVGIGGGPGSAASLLGFR